VCVVIIVSEGKDWEFISREEWEEEVGSFRRIYCKFIRWDILKKKMGQKSSSFL